MDARTTKPCRIGEVCHRGSFEAFLPENPHRRVNRLVLVEGARPPFRRMFHSPIKPLLEFDAIACGNNSKIFASITRSAHLYAMYRIARRAGSVINAIEHSLSGINVWHTCLVRGIEPSEGQWNSNAQQLR